jgi:hypothetical protein
MRVLVALLVLLALSCATCRTDDDVVENKRCMPVGTDPNRDCVKGYECRCEQGDCFCRKVQALAPSPSAPARSDGS